MIISTTHDIRWGLDGCGYLRLLDGSEKNYVVFAGWLVRAMSWDGLDPHLEMLFPTVRTSVTINEFFMERQYDMQASRKLISRIHTINRLESLSPEWEIGSLRCWAKRNLSWIWTHVSALACTYLFTKSSNVVRSYRPHCGLCFKAASTACWKRMYLCWQWPWWWSYEYFVFPLATITCVTVVAQLSKKCPYEDSELTSWLLLFTDTFIQEEISSKCFLKSYKWQPHSW